MEDWQKGIFDVVDTVVYELDQFIDGMTNFFDTVAQEIQEAIATQIDDYLQEILDPIVEIYAELDDVSNDPEIETYFYYPVEPTLEKNPACIGCHHYHGQVYGGNLFICGMHPYGWDDPSCPDWESSSFISNPDPDLK